MEDTLTSRYAVQDKHYVPYVPINQWDGWMFFNPMECYLNQCKLKRINGVPWLDRGQGNAYRCSNKDHLENIHFCGKAKVHTWSQEAINKTQVDPRVLELVQYRCPATIDERTGNLVCQMTGHVLEYQAYNSKGELKSNE